MVNNFLYGWRRFLDFKGVSTRCEFFSFLFGNLVVALLLGLISGLLESFNGIIIIYLFLMATIIPTLSICSRRFQDINQSGWLTLLLFVPVLSLFVLMAILLIPSKERSE